MHRRLLPAQQYRRERWKNQLGWTREIHRHPEGAQDWDWRVSIAEVDHDGPFSAFPGCDRELLLLSGEGMRLVFDDGETVLLEPPHGSLRFAGERPLRAELVAGPTHDFNLIWRRDRVTARVLHRPLVGAMLFFTESDVTWLVHVLRGQAELKHPHLPIRMEQGDSALIEPGEHGSRAILDGGGEVLLVRVERLPAPAADAP